MSNADAWGEEGELATLDATVSLITRDRIRSMAGDPRLNDPRYSPPRIHLPHAAHATQEVSNDVFYTYNDVFYTYNDSGLRYLTEQLSGVTI